MNFRYFVKWQCDELTVNNMLNNRAMNSECSIWWLWMFATSLEYSALMAKQWTWIFCLFSRPMNNEILLFSRPMKFCYTADQWTMKFYNFEYSTLIVEMNFEYSALKGDNELWIFCFNNRHWTLNIYMHNMNKVNVYACSHIWIKVNIKLHVTCAHKHIITYAYTCNILKKVI